VALPLFQLFTWTPPQDGFRLWWAVSFVCHAATVGLLAWHYGRPLVALWAFALAGLWDTLVLGQIYTPLALAAAGAWLALERGRPLPAGLLIGLVVAVKPNFLVWPALLLLSGHSRVALPALLTAGLLSLVPVALYGPQVYAQWVELVAGDSGRALFPTNASLTGPLSRLGLGRWGLPAALALLAGLGWWAWRRRFDPMRASALALVAALVASPIAWVHYTLFLLPIFFTAPATPLLVAAALVLLLPVPFVLDLLAAPLWQQMTLGSAYSWALLACLAALWWSFLRNTPPVGKEVRKR
jgi:hypothetical protein